MCQAPSLFTFFTIPVEEGWWFLRLGDPEARAQGQVCALPFPQSTCTQTNSISRTTVTVVLSTHPSPESTGNSSLTACGPLGAVTDGGDIAGGAPSLGCLLERPLLSDSLYVPHQSGMTQQGQGQSCKGLIRAYEESQGRQLLAWVKNGFSATALVSGCGLTAAR